MKHEAHPSTPRKDNGKTFSTPVSHPGTPAARRGSAAVETPARRGATAVVTPLNKALNFRSPPSCLPSPAPWKARDKEFDHALTLNSSPLLHIALQRGCFSFEDNVIFESVRSSRIEAVEFLLPRYQADVDRQCKGKRPLHLAIQYCLTVGDIGYRMAELLLQNGAEPDRVSGDDPLADSPLTEATKRCCIAAVGLLLSFEADPNVLDPAGFSPLHLACRQERLMFSVGSSICDMFHQLHLTDLHAQGPDGEAAPSSFPGVEQLVEMLLRKGASPLQLDCVGNLPIHYIPRGSTCLRSKLRLAEQHWSKQGMLVVQGRGCPSAEAKWSRIALHFQMPDTIDAFLWFL